MGATPHKAVTSRFPQEGGNRTSEALGVVFDPIIGEEDMETPLPNDSSKASLSPPVGGRLRSFRRDWQTNMFSKHVKHYHQWLRTAITFKAKFGQIPSDPVKSTRPIKKTKPWPLVSSLFCQRTQSKGWKM